MATAINLEAPGQYPIVLSDALAGRGKRGEVYTGIRYNHRPTSPTSNLHLTPSTPTDPSSTSYSLRIDSPSTPSSSQQYTGLRTAHSDSYVLIFDAEKQHFVLHLLDSSFDMNLEGVEGEGLQKLGNVGSGLKKGGRRKSSVAGDKSMGVAGTVKGKRGKRKVEAVSDDEEEEEEEEDSDGGLEIEYPDGGGPKKRGFGASMARSSFGRDKVEEEEDAEAESDNDAGVIGGEADAEGEENDLEADFEEELQAAFEEELGGGEGSSESEEE